MQTQADWFEDAKDFIKRYDTDRGPLTTTTRAIVFDQYFEEFFARKPNGSGDELYQGLWIVREMSQWRHGKAENVERFGIDKLPEKHVSADDFIEVFTRQTKWDPKFHVLIRYVLNLWNPETSLVFLPKVPPPRLER